MKQTLSTFRIAVSFAALALCLSASGPAFAADEEPKALYDLGSVADDVEADLEWPAPPQIENEVSVTSLSEFNDAASEPGTRVIVEAEIGGTGAVTADDVEVQMSDAGSLGGLRVERGVKRVALIGGQYNGTVDIVYPSTFSSGRVDNEEWIQEDITLDGINVDASGTAIFLRGKRTALLNSTTHSNDYAIFSDTASGFQNDDLIIAGNDLVSEGHQATVRLISAKTSVTVDNRITSLMAANGTKHNYRVHGQTGKSFAARNVLVNAGVMFSTMPNDHADTIWFNQNTFYHQTPDLFNPSRDAIDTLHAKYNRAYTDVWSKCFYCGGSPDGYDLKGNTTKPYKAPPSL